MKEKTVLVSAIIVSLVTAAATVISIARAGVCNRWRYAWKYRKVYKSDRESDEGNRRQERFELQNLTVGTPGYISSATAHSNTNFSSSNINGENNSSNNIYNIINSNRDNYSNNSNSNCNNSTTNRCNGNITSSNSSDSNTTTTTSTINNNGNTTTINNDSRASLSSLLNYPLRPGRQSRTTTILMEMEVPGRTLHQENMALIGGGSAEASGFQPGTGVDEPRVPAYVMNGAPNRTRHVRFQEREEEGEEEEGERAVGLSLEEGETRFQEVEYSTAGKNRVESTPQTLPCDDSNQLLFPSSTNPQPPLPDQALLLPQSPSSPSASPHDPRHPPSVPAEPTASPMTLPIASSPNNNSHTPTDLSSDGSSAPVTLSPTLEVTESSQCSQRPRAETRISPRQMQLQPSQNMAAQCGQSSRSCRRPAIDTVLVPVHVVTGRTLAVPCPNCTLCDEVLAGVNSGRQSMTQFQRSIGVSVQPSLDIPPPPYLYGQTPPPTYSSLFPEA
ncbi:hypothetical protein EGW08_004187 [Elysia chlorotica]|uniref:Uncharacterized protein n=1 Tax=Elysia chlorotica TaxID=188477 RepID=A0A433U2H1_ELYCH|nr:hypothetical protein EGW08_004187 [Elysia chlorotica]